MRLKKSKTAELFPIFTREPLCPRKKKGFLLKKPAKQLKNSNKKGDNEKWKKKIPLYNRSPDVDVC